MLSCSTWKARPLTPEQSDRMMSVWGKLEADMAARTDVTRVCWYINADGSGGMTVSESDGSDAANAFNLEVSLALGEFLEIQDNVVLDLDTAMPAIVAAMERAKG